MEGILSDEQEQEKRPPVIDPLGLKSCVYTDRDKTLYRVYVNATDYELTEAATAAEAIYKAKIKPFKVLRESKDNYNTLPRHKLAENDDGTIVYSDVALSDLSKAPKFHSFDVDSYQPDERGFVETDYVSYAALEAGFGGKSKLSADELDHSTKPSSEPAPTKAQTTDAPAKAATEQATGVEEQATETKAPTIEAEQHEPEAVPEEKASEPAAEAADAAPQEAPVAEPEKDAEAVEPAPEKELSPEEVAALLGE